MSKKFIDISEHNTILSFNGIASSDISGVIIKATEGTTYQDSKLESHYYGASGKIPVGFYHFLRATSQPETQAENFYNQIKDKNYEIMPVLDVETYFGNDELGEQAQDFSQRFIDEFRKLSGQEMLIYSARCYIEEHFDNIFKANNLWWVADYSANDVPQILCCKVVAWQYTESCQEYAFCNDNKLDVNILVDEQYFLISSFIPYSSNDEITDYIDIGNLQNELIVQGFVDKNGNELIIDGVAGELTLSACPVLRIGVQGSITAWLQKRLNISSDGVFGEQTRQAVIAFQENYSLDGDGVVGQNTWRKLLGMV